MTRQVHPAKFGSVEFDVLSANDSIEHAISQSVYPFKLGGDLRDRGTLPRVTTCEVIFFDRSRDEGEDESSELDYFERFKRFFVACNDSVSKQFRHPFTGGYRANVMSFNSRYSGDETDVVLVTVVFIEDGEPATFAITDRSTIGSIAAVNAAADITREELDALDLSAPAIDNAETRAATWKGTNATARSITNDIRRSTRELVTAQENLDLLTDPNRYPAYKAFQQLLYQLRQAAEAARRHQPQYQTITVARAVPLRVFCARRYGADQAERRMREVRAMNSIKDPGRLGQGESIRVPIDNTAASLPLQSGR